MDGNSRRLAQEFVVRCLIRILGPSPSADIVNQNSAKVRLTSFHSLNQLLQGVATIDSKTTVALISVGPDYFHSSPSRILADYFTRHGDGKMDGVATAIKFNFTADCEPITLSGKTASGKVASGVLMPCRMA